MKEWFLWNGGKYMSTMQKIVCIKENSFTRGLVELSWIL